MPENFRTNVTLRVGLRRMRLPSVTANETVSRVGDVRTGWGESAVWDDRRARLWFVDAAAARLHWMDGGDGPVGTLTLPSMATRVLLTDTDALLALLDDGIHVVDPDGGSTEVLTPYPAAIGGRCNDACVDPAGNIVTGKLNMGPAEGSAWWFSPVDGWRLLDDDISNTNGPQVIESAGATTLIIGDSAADYYAYDYDPSTGSVGERRVFGAVGGLGGVADGSALDTEGGMWCALPGGGHLVRFTDGAVDRTLPLPVENPTDVCFGGRSFDRLFVVSIGLGVDAGSDSLDGCVLAVDGLVARGVPERRFSLR